MFKLELTLTLNDNTSHIKTFKRNTLDELKRDEGDFILELAKEVGAKYDVYCDTVITENDEYFDSDSGYIFIYADYSGFEIAD